MFSVYWNPPEIDAVLLAVADERAELAGVHVVVQGEQVTLVELKSGGKLLRDLPHRVQELREDGRDVLGVHRAQHAAAICELVAESQPLLLYQRLHRRIRLYLYNHENK